MEDTVSHAAYTTPRSFAAAREREKRREKVIFRIFPSFFFSEKVVFFFFVENRLYTAINLTNGTNVTNYIVFRVRSRLTIFREIFVAKSRMDIFICTRKVSGCSTPSLTPGNEKKRRKFSRTRKLRRRMELDGSERKERNLKGRLDIFVP